MFTKIRACFLKFLAVVATQWLCGLSRVVWGETEYTQKIVSDRTGSLGGEDCRIDLHLIPAQEIMYVAGRSGEFAAS
jgi:hypothetical protein